MTLCLGIIEDTLQREAVFKNYGSTDNPFNLERCEIYRDTSVLMTGVLYLARPEELPERILIQDGAAMICIGMPSEPYLEQTLQLLVIDVHADLVDLSNEVNRIFFEYNTLEQKLQNAVNNGHNIQYMVEIIAPYLNSNELLVINDEYRIIGQSNPTLHVNEIPGLSQSVSDGWVSSEIMASFINDITYSKVKYMTEPYFYETNLIDCRSVCINVFHQDEFVCHITIVEDRQTFRGYESGLLSFFASFIQLIYDLSVDRTDIFPRNHIASIFFDLLSGEAVDEQRLKNCLVLHGWELNGPFLCSYVIPSERDYYNRTIPYYCKVFNREFKGCVFFEYDSSIVCVANLQYYGRADKGFIPAHINQ